MCEQLVVNVRAHQFDVYIGRARAGYGDGTWGNPFRLRRSEPRQVTIHRYKRWLFLERPDLVIRAREELAGKRLGCFCAPAPCHGDVLAHIANCEHSEYLRILRWMEAHIGDPDKRSLVEYELYEWEELITGQLLEEDEPTCV